MRNIVLFLFLLLSVFTHSQELDCQVIVNAVATGDENRSVFITLEKQLTEFVNNRKWTSQSVAPQERIACSMILTITKYSGDSFEGNLQVQSSRPVFGSSFITPVYNYKDTNVAFRYVESEKLNYSATQFESNLVSLVTFYIYTILGLDADTFSENGGTSYFDQAQTIVNYSQQESYKGWKLNDGLQTRAALSDNILSPTFAIFRKILYRYHRKGLDQMSEKPKLAKEIIAESLRAFETMNRSRPNSFLLRLFFDAKSTEIQQLFSAGPKVNIASLKETLNRIAPTYASLWQTIKF